MRVKAEEGDEGVERDRGTERQEDRDRDRNRETELDSKEGRIKRRNKRTEKQNGVRRKGRNFHDEGQDSVEENTSKIYLKNQNTSEGE